MEVNKADKKHEIHKRGNNVTSLRGIILQVNWQWNKQANNQKVKMISNNDRTGTFSSLGSICDEHAFYIFI